MNIGEGDRHDRDRCQAGRHRDASECHCPSAERERGTRRTRAKPAIDPADVHGAKVIETRQGGGGKLDLAEAPVVIAGGRGLKAAENFKLVEDLAAAFGNAAVGATRAVTDDGWRLAQRSDRAHGRLVSPQLYIAVGISGAVQHLAGMRMPKTIVAVEQGQGCADLQGCRLWYRRRRKFEQIPALGRGGSRGAKKKHH